MHSEISGSVLSSPRSTCRNPDPLAVLQTVVLGFLIGAPSYGVPGYLSLLTSFMASGPVAVAVANLLLGRPLNVGTAYRRALPVFWRLFWTWNLFLVVFFLVFVGIFILLFLILMIVSMALVASGLSSNALGPEFGVAFVILWIVLPYLVSCILGTALFAFAPPLIALEQLTVSGSVTRNIQLVGRRMFWRTCLAVVFLPIVTFGLEMLILWSASSVVTALNWPAWAAFVVNTGLSSLISFFFQPYWMIFVTIFYFDSRIRKEGLDVRFAADNLPDVEIVRKFACGYFRAGHEFGATSFRSPSPAFPAAVAPDARCV